MGGGRGKKRKHNHFAQEGHSASSVKGVGEALAHLRASSDEQNMPAIDGNRESESGEWQTISRPGKRQKQTNYPALIYSNSYRMQSTIKLGDLQSLVLYCLADGTSPQWVALRHHKMINKAVVLFVPGLEKGMFDGSIDLGKDAQGCLDAVSRESHEEPDMRQDRDDAEANDDHFNKFTKINPLILDEFLPTALDAEKLPVSLKPLAEIFPHIWPVQTPGDDRIGKVHSPLQAMLQCPISKTQEEKRADRETKGPTPAREGKQWENQRTRVTEYLLSTSDLQENEYVLHPANLETTEERENYLALRRKQEQGEQEGWKDTLVVDFSQGMIPENRIQQGSLSAGRKVLSMDCEMCKVEGGEFALTRISLVDWNGDTVLDELVKPDKPIIDYLTPYSGITAEALAPIQTNLPSIQSRLLSILTPQTILVGHSLNADLSALKLTHPFIIDTALLYPHPRGAPLKSSLKWLAQKYLSREIQKGHGIDGHDSIEDAKTCLDLVKLKCEKGPAWGTNEAAHESIFKRLKRSAGVSSLSSPLGAGQGAIIDYASNKGGHSFKQMAPYSLTGTSDADIVSATKRAVLGDVTGEYIPGGGLPFTWARFRELEIFRGWRNDDVTANQAETISSNPAQTTNTTSNSSGIPNTTVLSSTVPSSHTTNTSTSANPDLAANPISDPNPNQSLNTVLSRTITHIQTVRSFLPPRSLFIVYSGTGDPREMARLQEMQRQYRREFKVKKWDELSVHWTDVEEQALKRAVRKARQGCGFVCVT